MKLFICIMMIVSLLASGCASSKVIDGKVYEPYGLVNQDAVKSNDVDYEVSFGSIVVGAVFIETAIVPIYVFGWDLFEAHKKVK